MDIGKDSDRVSLDDVGNFFVLTLENWVSFSRARMKSLDASFPD